MTDPERIVVHAGGADLAVQAIGDGAPLLVIAGGGGTGARHAPLVEHMRGRRVILYDRRACGASGGERDAPLDLDQQAADAATILEALGPADVFGNSGGGTIALRLVETRPDLVRRTIVHEPPILPLLPDARELLAHSDAIAATFRAASAPAAFALFLSRLDGLNGPPPGPRPDPADIARFLGHELTRLCRYEPDLPALRGRPLAVLAGAASGDAYPARAAVELARAAGAPFARMPGHHFPFDDPAPLAVAIEAGLARAVRSA